MDESSQVMRHSDFSAFLLVRGSASLVAIMYALDYDVLKAQTSGEQFTTSIHTFDGLGTSISCLEISVSCGALLHVVTEHQMWKCFCGFVTVDEVATTNAM